MDAPTNLLGPVVRPLDVQEAIPNVGPAAAPQRLHPDLLADEPTPLDAEVEALKHQQEAEAIAQVIARRRALASLKGFLIGTLGYALEPPHDELCRLLQSPSKKKLFLMPRLTWKTSIMTGYVIAKILKQPNIRILIVSELLKNSKKMLAAIEHYFEAHEGLRALFGDLVPTKEQGKWNDMEMVVTTRTTMAKEPTVMVGGVDTEITSLHFDLIICDDLMGKDNTQTKEQIDKVWEFFRLLAPLLDPQGTMIVLGTRWHFADIYDGLLKDQRFERFVIGATSDGTLAGPLLFPRLLPAAFLEDQKVTMGSSEFIKQYMNRIVDDETAKFKRGWLKTWNVLPSGLYVTTTIDPAISKEETADYSAIVTVGTDHEGLMYMLEAIQGRWNPTELVQQTFEARGRWHPHRVGLEKHGFQQTLEFFLKDEMRRRNEYFSIEELKVDSRHSKESRIEGLVPLFEHGRILLPSTDDALAWQLIEYPKSAHDDLLDALAHQLQINGRGQRAPLPRPTGVVVAPLTWAEVEHRAEEADRIHRIPGNQGFSVDECWAVVR